MSNMMALAKDSEEVVEGTTEVLDAVEKAIISLSESYRPEQVIGAVCYLLLKIAAAGWLPSVIGINEVGEVHLILITNDKDPS